MKHSFLLFSFVVLLFSSCGGNNNRKVDTTATTTTPTVTTSATQPYFIDVHDLEPGKVSFKDVEGAHQKDLATQDKYGVKFLKFWVDEKKGKVYCLSQATNESSVTNTHKEAHGLIPANVYQVSGGTEVMAMGNKQSFIDVHEMGSGKVTAKDVAGAHAKDLAVQGKYGVNFTNYWVDEKKGIIMCMSEAPNSDAVKKAHKEAHGLLPAYVLNVKQGE
ncbi:hypothetical protein GCM10022408_24100 [Hymenobacter fastidiosus]|uniref:DUF4242 domain-containing protein n=1 Tax=Hymenobacter fastidiosus TaxID=486264 RepID=A0ABP7SF58_9BACT